MSFAPLEPVADGFRNYLRGPQLMSPEEALVDRAQLLKLSAPEMTVLVGGLRVLGGNTGQSKHGVFTQKLGTLTNDFFVNLLDMRTEWQAPGSDGVYQGCDRKRKEPRWTRPGLRGRVDQGDEPRSLRLGKILTELSDQKKAAAEAGGLF